jgi:hypothetical protein
MQDALDGPLGNLIGVFVQRLHDLATSSRRQRPPYAAQPQHLKRCADQERGEQGGSRRLHSGASAFATRGAPSGRR